MKGCLDVQNVILKIPEYTEPIIQRMQPGDTIDVMTATINSELSRHMKIIQGFLN